MSTQQKQRVETLGYPCGVKQHHWDTRVKKHTPVDPRLAENYYLMLPKYNKYIYHTFAREFIIHLLENMFICICDTNMAFKHISLLSSAKGVIMGQVGECPGKKNTSPGHLNHTAFLPEQKTHVTTFGSLGGLAFYSAYDIK